MTSPDDVVMGQGDDLARQPFTIEENIDQLNDIGRSAVQLMSYAATALNCLTTPGTGSSTESTSKPALDASSQKEAFRTACDSFLTTLQSINVRMKRQLLALEEAGIVDLASDTRQDPSAAPKPSLKPNGVGSVGNLDVGWLNSRSWRVEREMEAELWQEAREFLEKHGEKLKMG